MAADQVVFEGDLDEMVAAEQAVLMEYRRSARMDDIDDAGAPGAANRINSRRFVVGMLLAASVGAAVAVAVVKIGARADVDMDAAVEYVEINGGPDEVGQCGPGGDKWTGVSTVDHGAREAADKALKLVMTERTGCQISVPAFAFGVEDFFKGEEHKHHLHVHHKFSANCESETYKLHFFLGSGTTAEQPNDMSFVLQVNRNFRTKAWTLLSSDPTSCKIQAGSASAPQVVPRNSGVVQKAAEFAVGELNYQLKKNNCGVSGVELEDVKAAVATVKAGMFLKLSLEVKVDGQTKTASLTVIDRCAGATSCVRQLEAPEGANGNLCSTLEDKNAVERKLSTGAVPNDPTELFVAQRQALFQPRRLAESSRTAMQPRNIQAGSIPSSLDLRSDPCYEKTMVYDQGSCGSCYAQAVGQMMGIRKCLLDRGTVMATGGPTRRLLADAVEGGETQSVEDGEAHHAGDQSGSPRELGATRTTTRGCQCKVSNSLPGCTDSYCCNPDQSSGDWCFVASESCQGTHWGYCKEPTPVTKKPFTSLPPTQAPTQPPTTQAPTPAPTTTPYTTPPPPTNCADSSLWKDRSGRGCPWYAANDKGCKNTDVGQRSHCKITCGTCPPVVNPQEEDTGMWFKYMPSVNDLAQCAKNADGSMQGCDGGNTQGVWNNWLKDLSRDVWVMGDACKPYTLKCKSSKGVTNPLSGGMCSNYKDRQLWHKPCSCIPQSDRPKSFQCPSSGPSGSCGFDVPSAMFTVKGVEHGLSTRDAVKNFQRHILEFGPIYFGFSTTDQFMKWSWKTRPVYTGGGQAVGGHAVTGIGWGSQQGVDFWLIRNSWGADWADKGYAKFRRGVNLDRIEDSSSASMAGSDYKDWSPPFCQIDSWTRSSGAGGYRLALKILCSKACSMTIFTSVRLTDRKQIQYGVSGMNLNGQGKAKQVVDLAPFNMAPLGFGQQAGDMWLKITADDGKGNSADNSQFITIPKSR